MRRLCVYILGGLLLPLAVLAQKPRIRIVYPRENQGVAARDSTFIFGNVTQGSRLWINEASVPVYENGAFLAFLPISPDAFVFRCTAVLGQDTTTVARHVQVSTRMASFPEDSLGFDTTYLHPTYSSVLRPGNVFEVEVKGTPGCRAFFDIEGLAWGIPMTERVPLPHFPWGDAVFGDLKVDTTFVRGIYTGVYEIKAWDMVRDAAIVFHLSDASSDTVSIRAAGTLTVDGSSVPTIGVLTDETVIARPSPGQAYTWFLPKGVKLRLTGKRGVWHRVELADNHRAWIPEGSFQVLPPGTPIPGGVVRFVRAESFNDRVRVSIPLEERLPFHIRQRTNPPSLIVTLYGVSSDTDWIPQDFSDPIIGDIRWHQRSNRVYELEILLNQRQQWGYDPRYNGTTLEIDIRKGPKIAGWPYSVFKDIVFCVDAGHHPDPGAVGPTGLEERTVNLAVARYLQKMLEGEGAVVVMTRGQMEGISLGSRPRMASVADADILVSIHFNALPDGVNPWKNNGSSIYYYQPMSRGLARAIHTEVLKLLRLPDFGIYYANLALCRPTQMPAVLTEEAFMMIPEQEMMLARPEFQQKCARAIFKGLERFLKESR